MLPTKPGNTACLFSQERQHLLRKLRRVKRLSVTADCKRIERPGAETGDGIGKRVGRLLIEEDACLTRDHAAERPACAIGDHRPATGLRLHWRQTKVFLAGEDQRLAARELRALLLIREPSQKADIGLCHRPQTTFVAPLANDAQW